jgi:CheY-like chemotaxis protein
VTAALFDAHASSTASRTRVKSVMLVGLHREALLRLAPALQAHAIELVEAADPRQALDLATGRRFDLLVVRHPLDGIAIDEFLTLLRRPGCRSHRVFALVLTEGASDKALDHLQGARSRFVNATEFDVILSVIAQNGLGVAPRVDGNLMVRLGLTLFGQQATRFCQVRNISESGMLVRIAERPPIGEIVSLTFSLPQSSRPLELEAQVVRHTGVREIEGVALRFVRLDRATRGYLRDYVGSRL